VLKNEINVEFTNILNGLINKYAGINSDLGKRIDIIKENFDSFKIKYELEGNTLRSDLNRENCG
jgi:hypothetical protein